MRNVFPDPRHEESQPPEHGKYAYDEEPPRYGEADLPSSPAAPREPYASLAAEPERGRGCSWLLVFILLLGVGVVSLVSWGVTRMILSGTVQPLRQNYRTLSLMPAQRLQVPKAEMQLQIYYIARGRSLASETRRLRKPASENERLRLIAQELKAPPSGKMLENPLPTNTEIRGIYLMNGIAYVDLSAEFVKVDNPTPLRERLAVYALVNSLMLNNRSIQGVQVMIDGRSATTAWGWLDLSSPLGPDLSLQTPAPGVNP